MLISEFSAATGLSRDTVRYYMRLGLLQPKTNGKGGSKPYHFFTGDDMQAVDVIRVGQALGWSLKDIAALDTERRAQGIAPARAVAILRGQLAEIEAKAAELNRMGAQLRDKLDWLEQGAHGAQPGFGTCGCRVAAPGNG